MRKFKAILRLLALIIEYFITGLRIIIFDGYEITNFNWTSKKIKKKPKYKKPTDKEIFLDFMARNT